MLYLALTLAAAALAPGLKAPGRTPQVLRLRDATTGQEISLVGTVHYNPASVARAKDEVSSALDRSTVGAVVVESCTSRWGPIDKPSIEQKPADPIWHTGRPVETELTAAGQGSDEAK